MISKLLFISLIAIVISQELKVKATIQGFFDFKKIFNRKYISSAEEAQRFDCFAKNVAEIEALNSRGDRAVYGINKFSDWCPEEFKRVLLTLDTKEKNLTNVPVVLKAGIPKVTEVESFDWREKGAVTPIKDQGKCGSCWAFSAVCTMEGAWFLAGHELTAFSEEQLVDCAPLNKGCQGGNPFLAIIWVILTRGITSEDDYPYTSGQTGMAAKCQWSKMFHKVGVFKKVIPVIEVNENDITSYLQAYGPLSIAVDASDWKSYRSGIKTVCSARGLNHAVNIVGFGVENEMPYWIIRNTWSESWGENGYIRVQRNVNCDGLATLVIATSTTK